MIQNVNATQSRQNFGMAVKKAPGFQERFLSHYATKGPQETQNMLDAIQQVEKEQADNPIFDMLLEDVGPLGGIKTKIESKKTTYNNDARTITLAAKLTDILNFFVPAKSRLTSTSEYVTKQATNITDSEKVVGDSLKAN